MKNEDGTYTYETTGDTFTRDELIDFMNKVDQGQ
jgi:hypothetical protein